MSNDIDAPGRHPHPFIGRRLNALIAPPRILFSTDISHVDLTRSTAILPDTGAIREKTQHCCKQALHLEYILLR